MLGLQKGKIMETILIYVIAIVIACIIHVWIGGLIGATKNRKELGQRLGFFAGPFGWLIMALLQAGPAESQRRVKTFHASRGITCPMCSKLVTQGNISCPQCGSSLV
jgi:DNA-directed RNA polymerase subunit RPC12/RpoP